jgi:LruC domain-containing protein
MNMKTNTFAKLIFLLLISGIFASCNTKPNDNPKPQEDKTMEDLVIPKTFEWSTSKPANLSITAKDNQNQAIQGARISIYTADPDSGGLFIASGITDASGVYTVNHEVPAYYTNLFVRSDYVGLPSPGMVDLNDNGFNITLGGTQKNTPFKSGRQAKSTQANYKFLGSYNSQGVPDYLEPQDDPIDRQFLNDINNTLPERKKLPNSHPQYFSNQYDHNVHLNAPADVWVTFVSEGAGYRNVLGFYTYPTNQPPQTADDIDSITIIFPNVSFQGSGGGLHAGNKVKIGNFPANTSIGFVLMANGWKNGVVTDGNWVLYSQKGLNPESDANLQQHSVLLSDNARDLFLLSFEDIRRDNRSCDQDFNDAIFYVTANPIQSVDQSNTPLVDYTGTDSDQDGVPDHFDDYPTDDTRAFNNFYFNQGEFGTLAFEDLWPSVGDYDFNDAVIDYNFNQITNGENKVVEIKGTFVLRAQGAYFHNGFGIQLPIDNNLVSAVTGDIHVPGNIVSLDNRNLETNQTKAVIMLWEDGYDVLPHPGQGLGVNTEASAPYVVPDTMRITISLTQPVTLDALGNPPYNPFIFSDGIRGNEIHLPDHVPTDLMNTSLFGTGADDSKPAEGRYYKTAKNLPWGINLIERFDYPYEKVEILSAYNHFGEWAESGGTQYTDWYLDKSGYRNSANIYVVPAK